MLPRAVSEPPAKPDQADLSAAAREAEAALERLGIETEASRTARRVLPWIVSIGAHVGMVLLGLLVTWTVVMLGDDDEPVLIVADFDSLTYEPTARLEATEAPQQRDAAQDQMPTEVFEDRLTESDTEIDALRLISTGAAAEAMAQFAPESNDATASFVGLTTSNARNIVYVIDASGSMLRALPVVVEELARSLEGLSPRQRFGIVFFQRNEALVVPPANRLTRGTRDEVVRVLGWIDNNVIPEGRSNPLAAIRKAIDFEPDVIFLLSERITGEGEFEIDQRDLLAMLEEINPQDPDSGRRPVQINCIQFLVPDELDTLRIIAEKHGGARGYKFLDAAELGLNR